MKRIFSCIIILTIWCGFIIAIVESYKIRNDIHLNNLPIGDYIEFIFMPFISINLIFWGELVYSISFNISLFPKKICILFLVQLLLGGGLVVSHLGYWIDVIKNNGFSRFMKPQYQNLGYLVETKFYMDTLIGLCLFISSMCFFVICFIKQIKICQQHKSTLPSCK